MHRLLHAAIAVASLLLGGCTVAESANAPDAQATAGVQAALPVMTVHKHPACGCCGAWIDHMKRAGFAVVERNVEDMVAIKHVAGVPEAMGSCHTAEVGGYFIEGHVPPRDVLRLLREQPAARGLALPGMPVGSPGMEHPDGLVQPYAVSLVLADGSVREFSRHPGK